MTKGYLVELEDLGQDFTTFETTEIGEIIAAKPFQTDIWKGGYIPIKSQGIGDLCMMHKPPEFVYGFLKYKVIKITPIEL